jgi:DNA polymerase-3 subunit gamma/tau
LAYEAFSRKYRPKSFQEVIGQEHVVKTLKNAVKLDRVSHAYIFSGPRGVGKTTIARILAKVLNCKNPVDYEPCNQCENCIEIDKGSFPDMYEIDAASNRGIDDIRMIRDNVGYQPIKGKYKVYIIDEAHMLTKEAFNALLKTLEEPPPRNIFILATTELYKIPETIKSRCQTFIFKPPTKEQIKNYLLRILNNEKIPYEEDAVELLAQELEGGMRDSASLLDQAVTYAEGKLTRKDVEEILGIVPYSYVQKFLRNIKELKVDENIKLIDTLEDEGYDINVFWKQLLEAIHKTLIDLALDKEDKIFSKEDLKSLIYLKTIFTKAYSEARTFFDPKQIYHLTILKTLYLDSIKKIEQLFAEGVQVVPKKEPEVVKQEIKPQEKQETKQQEEIKPKEEQKQDSNKIINQIIKNEKVIAVIMKNAEIKEDENAVYIKVKSKSEEDILRDNMSILTKYFSKEIFISSPEEKKSKVKESKKDEAVEKVLELFPGSKIITYKKEDENV